MPATFLAFYLAANVFLALAFVVFKAIRSLPRAWRPDYQGLNVLGIALFAMALVFPPLFTLLPGAAVPDVRLRLQAPVAESAPPTAPRTKAPALQAQVKDVTPIPPSEPWPITEIFAGLLTLAILYRGIRLGLRLRNLRALIAEAILIRRIGRVRIFALDDLKIPFATRVGGGANIVLPTELVARRGDYALVLRHELQHHRSGDTWWALFIEGAGCAFPLNPFVYFWKKEMIETQEFACDEALIRQVGLSMRAYGSVLVRIAEEARGFRHVQVGTTCMGSGPRGPHQLKSFLGRRIEVFKDHQASPRRKRAGLIIGTLSACVLATAALGAQKTLRSSTPNAGAAKFDPFVQKTAQEILDDHVRKFGAKGGFVVVADPRTGRVLAAAQAHRNPRVNARSWALSYALEPASLVKPLVFATGVDRALFTPEDIVDGENGQYVYGGRIFRDWKKMKRMTATQVVHDSSNIGGIKLAEKIGASGLEVMLQQFGFGPRGSAGDFPGAATGEIPRARDLPETDYVPLLSTGYSENTSFAITPLEMVQAYGVFANHGKLMQPLEASRSEADARMVRQVLSSESAGLMKTVLVGAVTDGTGRNARSSLYTTAGKTSTAYHPDSPEHNELGGERGIAGFVGFAPVGAPRLVVYVAIFEPTSSKDGNPHGNEHAAPVFREVIEKVLTKWNVPSDK